MVCLLNPVQVILEQSISLAKKICPSFTLTSSGEALRYGEGLFGDYILQTLTVNRRVVYKRDNPVDAISIHFMSIPILGDENAQFNNSWVVRTILQCIVKLTRIIKLVWSS